MTPLFEFSAQSAVEFASQFAQVFFVCAALVIAGYGVARYAGYEPRPAKPRSKTGLSLTWQRHVSSSTPVAPAVADIAALEPWDAALIHAQEARECQATADELAESAEYMIARLRGDLQDLSVKLPVKPSAQPVPVEPYTPALAA
jgi:hypothetical protein